MAEIISLKEAIEKRKCRYFMAMQAELAEVVKKHMHYGATATNSIGACGILLADLLAAEESERATYLREIVYDFIDKSTDERIQRKLEERDDEDSKKLGGQDPR